MLSFTESSHALLVDHFPETVPFRLLLTLPASRVKPFPFNLDQIELHFHFAQANDSLSELHCLLHIMMGLRDYQFKQIRPSQHVGMQAHNLVN
jgi:hypothetical protein